MVLECLRSKKASDSNLKRNVMALISAEGAFAEVFETAMTAQGFECRRFSAIRRFAKKTASGELAVLIWDSATVEPDWEVIAKLDRDTTVLLAGGRPTINAAALNPTVISVPGHSLQAQVPGLTRLFAGAYMAFEGRRQAEAALKEREKETQDAVQLSEQLQEHCEFYELQRNRLSETVRRTAYLGQLSKEINCLDIDRIVEICVTKLPKLVDAELVSVYFHNEENRELVLKSSSHPYPLTERI